MTMRQDPQTWAPLAYSGEDLANAIKRISEDYVDRFYFFPPESGRRLQGDILKFHGDVPFLNECAQPRLYKEFEFWMILSNSCDIDNHDVYWATVIPLTRMTADIDQSTRAALMTYRHYKKFYVPPWPGNANKEEFCAEFLMPVLLNKKLIYSDIAAKTAQLSFYGWIILNSCLIRFLARNDGRCE